ncbi:hypothetical protein NEOKW01_1079 [Nematocida sp. AWRm80]|nr:hypothetical protein NEOKW01_1079 [Nematocida sp. AWRm80]
MLRYYTVEYDGCTYKKPEEKEKKLLGCKYFLDALEATPEEKKEVKRIISRVNIRSKWKDLTEKQERLYQKMEKILGKLKAYTPFSAPFLSKVSKREAPEYYTLIKNPMDLSKISKKLHQQEYSSEMEFISDLDLIWSNCFEFNNDHGNIYAMYAQKMKEKASILLQDLYAEREVEIEGSLEEIAHLHRTEKQRKEMFATRSAILQHPMEFVSRRTSNGMKEYWTQEIHQIDRLSTPWTNLPDTLDGLLSYSPEDPERPVYLPEYTHFYNSFPVSTQENKPIPMASEYTLDQILQPIPSAHRDTSKLQDYFKTQAQKQTITYSNGIYSINNTEITDLIVNKAEVYILLKRSLAEMLIVLGYNTTESQALDILISYSLQQIEKISFAVSALEREILLEAPQTHQTPETHTNTLLREIIQQYNIKPIDLLPDTFFSESEEDLEEEKEDILDLVYSGVDDIEPLEDII